VGIVVSDFSRCVPVSEWETGWGISGHSGDVGFGSPCLTFPSAGSEHPTPENRRNCIQVDSSNRVAILLAGTAVRYLTYYSTTTSTFTHYYYGFSAFTQSIERQNEMRRHRRQQET